MTVVIFSLVASVFLSASLAADYHAVLTDDKKFRKGDAGKGTFGKRAYLGDKESAIETKSGAIRYGPFRLDYVAADGRRPPSDTLTSVQGLKPCAELLSGDGRWKLVYQADGDLAGYPTLPGVWKAFWTAGVVSSAPGYAAVVDGNLNLYDKYNAMYWTTATTTKGIPPYYRLVMQNDRNIVIYDSNFNATWASNTGG